MKLIMSKRKPSILYSRRIEHEGVDDQLFHHLVFAGGVRAAGTVLEVAVRIEAVVVVRHHFVEIGVGTFAGGVGVVEDDVLNHAQAGLVQALDHGAVFADAVIGIDGVAAFRSHVVHGIIAPVIGGAGLDWR